MKLLFDLTAIQPSKEAKFHGGGLYGEVVFFALLQKIKDFVVIYDSKLYINPNILKTDIKFYDINNISPKDIAVKENINIFYTPLYNKDDKWQLDVNKYKITWHDTRGLELPIDKIALKYNTTLKGIIKTLIQLTFKNYYLKRIKSYYNKLAYVKNAEYITVSEHSKHSIINFYPHLKSKNISVFYSPLNDMPNDLPPLKLILKSYFLLTSSARWEKNNLRTVFAFDSLFNSHKDIDFNVVLTGVTNQDIYIKNIKNKNKFIFYDYIDRKELLSLHKNAYAFIYPSLNEGFGYPPVESMYYGVPVAASGSSSIPEICGDAALYFNPFSVEEIKNRILQLLNNEIYSEYSDRAIKRYKIINEKQKSDLDKIVNFIIKE